MPRAFFVENLKPSTLRHKEGIKFLTICLFHGSDVARPKGFIQADVTHFIVPLSLHLWSVAHSILTNVAVCLSGFVPFMP